MSDQDLRTQLLRRLLLETLKQAGAYLLPERALRMQCQLAVPDLRVAEADEALRWAETERLIIGGKDSLGAMRWRITDLGRSILSEMIL
jgi:hypothetical protein